MQYTILRGTGLHVSRICLGTMMFGQSIDEKDGAQIVDYAMEKGVNFFDTADIYTGGRSETILGKALKGRRDEVILASKVGFAASEERNDTGLSRRHILQSVERSLKRLDTDYLDLYYLHCPDGVTPMDETLSTMDKLVRDGKIRYVAVSNHAAWEICQQKWLCRQYGWTAPCVSQNVYNVITRGLERELAPFLRAYDMGMVIYNPIAGGLLAGKHKYGQPASDTRFAWNQEYYDRYWNEANFHALDALTDLAAENGLSILQLALKWCVQQPCVDAVIVRTITPKTDRHFANAKDSGLRRVRCAFEESVILCIQHKPPDRLCDAALGVSA